ncbi:hypothetical protein PR048_013302 [Dryococelus australis]|uniref:Reverse transcriptase RNase H-like domain-containing protein n=1 Tax=Dryococelus australis TaxID=614101 RepID=A0ABQ9HRS1_9NEOP|nr:hypothetical protein PR048_013302 [Dryococelus australis]
MTTNCKKYFVGCQEVGLTLNKDKCKLSIPKVQFLSVIVNKHGIYPDGANVRTINKAPEPRNMTELDALLGLLNFYESFLTGKAHIAEPPTKEGCITPATKEGCKLEAWNNREKNLFRHIQSSYILEDHIEDKPLLLMCDASPYGLGAILAVKVMNGYKLPATFVSQTMSPVEHNYGLFDQESLAVVYGVHKFQTYLLRCIFTIYSDHKPLLNVFDQSKPIPRILSPCTISFIINRYPFKYRPGNQLGNADALSNTVEDPPNPEDIFFLEAKNAPYETVNIDKITDIDDLLRKVKQWSKFYFIRIPELSATKWYPVCANTILSFLQRHDGLLWSQEQREVRLGLRYRCYGI